MKMGSWEKAKKIFAEAIKVAPEMRLQYLNEVCADDEDTHREVESLLASFDQAEKFMKDPAVAEVADVIQQTKNLESGKCIGHYEIIKQIGTGGMGKIYLAKDNRLDREVAVKVLNDRYAKHDSNLQRFIHEAKAASSLNHPNILVIHEILEAESAHYIVSEFIKGKTLRDYIEESQLKLLEVLDIAVQVANALSTAHTAHIVHRDIKPENIMIRPDGFVKVLDFGLAKLVRQKAAGFNDETVKPNETAKGIILGTVNYMSPEQSKGEKVDERTDIFSFGAVVYEMIAGKTPFAGNTVSEAFANLINTEPPLLSRFDANLPDELQRIVSKMLKKNKDERYQTMKDVLTDLKSLRENLAFDERLEKSASPRDENATAALQTVKGDANDQTDETNYNFTRQIKRNKPLAALALIALLVGTIGVGYYFWPVKKSASNADGKKSLAVLPFVNASQDPNAEYLSDGITESIINNLSQLTGLRVMSRNSAFRFKNNQTNTKNIASQLGVETLVTGDIQQVGDRLVINVRLIDPSDDSQIWGNQYVKTSTDIISTQNEIAQAVANNLRVKLSNSERQRLGRNYTENVEAYQLYLKGRFHIFKLTPPEVNKGISYFQQAIEIDPNYALAYAGISDAYRSLTLGGEMLPSEFLPKSKAAANKAIEIDETLTEGHTALGSVSFWQWEWNAAEGHYKRALELNPNSGDAHLLYAHLLSNTGWHTEALAEVKLARELDPLFPFAEALEGQFLHHAGQVDKAIAKLKKATESQPNFWMPHLFASSAYIEKEMYPEAITAARRARELSPALTMSTAFECYALAKSGRRDEARAALDELLKLSTTRFVPPLHIALIYNGLGETDKTFVWLERGFKERDPKMTFLKVDTKFNNLRQDPRFQDLLKRMGFQQ